MSALLRGADGEAVEKAPKPSAGKGAGSQARKRQGGAGQQVSQSSGAMASTAGSAAGQAPHQRQVPAQRGNEAPPNIRELTIQVAQLGLSAMSSIRTLQAISIETVMIDRQLKYTDDSAQTEVNLVDVIKKTTKNHFDALQAMDTEKERQALGPPFPHVWLEMLAWLEAKYADVKAPEQSQGSDTYDPIPDITAIRKYLELIRTAPREVRLRMVTDDIRHCRIAKTYKKVQVKLEVALSNYPTQTTTDAWTAVKRLLIALGATPKQGAAPRGNSERVVSRLLSELGRVRADDWDW
eukprot:TRINITY_DN10900_c0_g1_i3.p2 TRINITY_DN10900_c0_g1~~TRINITY_DN10900_c0_g1_i3.p2  ORF type:complete len:295 (-),score=69.67 TRINITY_DN10900_c0_g1_i3:810-1694(-)